MEHARRLFAISLSFTLSLGLALWFISPTYADPPAAPPSRGAFKPSPGTNLTQVDPAALLFPADPLLSPAEGQTVNTFQPTFDWADATDPTQTVVSYTLLITTGLAETISLTTIDSIYTPTTPLFNGVFTWTVQAHDDAGNVSDYVTPSAVFTITATAEVYLPILVKPEPSPCPITSEAVFTLIPIEGSPADHPDYLHGDLNLNLRGYTLTNASPNLVNYSGGTDSNAPQLAGLFVPNKFPGIKAVYRVNDWIWGCGTHGCPGSPLTNFPVTLMSLNAVPGEPISIPERSPNIYGGDYKVMVLYAEEQRITLGYTRQDTVAGGYAVHIENICVDPNLLALYRSRVNFEGWRINPPMLPALRNNQMLGIALNGEVLVAIRDRGAFMDPRSGKDWWPGY